MLVAKPPARWSHARGRRLVVSGAAAVKRWGGHTLIAVGVWPLVLAIFADTFARVFPVSPTSGLRHDPAMRMLDAAPLRAALPRPAGQRPAGRNANAVNNHVAVPRRRSVAMARSQRRGRRDGGGDLPAMPERRDPPEQRQPRPAAPAVPGAAAPHDAEPLACVAHNCGPEIQATTRDQQPFAHDHPPVADHTIPASSPPFERVRPSTPVDTLYSVYQICLWRSARLRDAGTTAGHHGNPKRVGILHD
jgi:hypothetical protein